MPHNQPTCATRATSACVPGVNTLAGWMPVTIIPTPQVRPGPTSVTTSAHAPFHITPTHHTTSRQGTTPLTYPTPTARTCPTPGITPPWSPGLLVVVHVVHVLHVLRVWMMWMMLCMLDVWVGWSGVVVGVGRIVPDVPVVRIMPPRSPYETPPGESGARDASWETTRSPKPRYHKALRQFRRLLGVRILCSCNFCANWTHILVEGERNHGKPLSMGHI